MVYSLERGQQLISKEQGIITQIPQLESRIGAQEQMTTILHARLVELAEDMTASFRQQADYQINLEHTIEARFTKIETDLGTVKEDLSAVKGDLSGVKADLDTVKGDVTTIKENVTTLETRILDAFKQLISTIDSRLPPSS